MSHSNIGASAPAPRSPQRQRIFTIAMTVAVIFAVGNIVAIVMLASGSDADPGASESRSPEPSESADSTSESPSAAAPDVPPLEVSFDVPEGFEARKDFSLIHPLYEDRKEQFVAMPDVDTDEAIWVVSYVLPHDTSDWDNGEMMAAVEEFADTINKTNDSEPQATSYGHRPAVIDYVEAGDDGKLNYDAYYFFEDHHLVQVGCQYDKEEEAVGDGCTTVIDSLKW